MKARRGLSSVVGAIFMILVMAAGLNVALWTMQQQDRVTEAVVEKANSNLGKLNEEIDISDIRISNKKLNVTVANAGGAAAILKSIYIVNETANQQFRYDLDDIVVDGRDSVNNIGQSLPLTIKNGTDYSIKVMTESGNSVTTTITSLSRVALPMSLYLIPPSLTPGENVTVLYAVTNNLTGSDLGREVELNLGYSLGCTAGPGCELSLVASPSSNVTLISKGNTMLFKWVFTADVPDKTYITFNASLADAKQGNYVTETAYVRQITQSDISGSTTTVIFSSLVQKPEIFLILPSPAGEDGSGGKALWGVVVVNPTSVPMSVSRVIISAATVITDRTERIIDNNGTPCPNTPIYPNPASEWTCPEENLIQWKDTSNPEVIQGYDVRAFMAKYEPGSLGGGGDDPAFLVSASVFTTFGQFTKTGYSTGMKQGGDSLANVYLTDTINESTALNTAHIFGNMSSLKSATQKDIYVAMADFGRNDAFGIKSGTQLIINVPSGFEVTGLSDMSYIGFNNPPTVTEYTDGSTQIIATLSANLGMSADAEAVKILKFRVTLPTVTSTKVYIMHTLVKGETQPNNFSIGSIGEFPMQVIP